MFAHANPNPMFCNARTNMLEPYAYKCSKLFTCVHIILHWPHAHLLEEIVGGLLKMCLGTVHLCDECKDVLDTGPLVRYHEMGLRSPHFVLMEHTLV